MAVHPKEGTQRLPRIRPTEPVRAQGHIATARHERPDLLGHRLHVVGGRHDRPDAARQRGFGVAAERVLQRMQAVPAFGLVAVAAQFRIAGHAPDVGGHAEVLLQEICGGQGLAQDRAATQQLHPQRARLRLAQAVHALQDTGLGTRRHGRMRGLLVDQRQVVENVFLILA
ncbi:hypothetical protein G6F65_021130 [Rhizopus arrhizus]|nr:hypothetical protein G6F65_021130 [Rhizopus arrhizus]